MDECLSPWCGDQANTPNISRYSANDSGYLSHSGNSTSETEALNLGKNQAFNRLSHVHWQCTSPLSQSSVQEVQEEFSENELPLCESHKSCHSTSSSEVSSGNKRDSNEYGSLTYKALCGKSQSLQEKLLAASSEEESKSTLPRSRTHSYLEKTQPFTQIPAETNRVQPETEMLDLQPPIVVKVSDNVNQSVDCQYFSKYFGGMKETCGSSPIITSGETYVRTSGLCRSRVDILASLANYQPVVSRILQFLGPDDLVAVATVSHTWRNICKNDKKANRRRQLFLKAKVQLKENRNESTPYARAQQHSRRYLGRGACSELQNLRVPSPPKEEPSSPPVSPSKVRFHLFFKEGGKLSQGEYLMRCPRCTLPSHIRNSDNHGRCSHPSCLFEFCIHCHSAPHTGKSCRTAVPGLQSQYRRMRNSVGSAASRRNLRKLLL